MDVPSHEHSSAFIETAGEVLAPEGFQFGRKDVDDLEPDPGVPGRIPGNVPEGREQEGRKARQPGHLLGAVQKGCAKPQACELRQDVKLLDVETALQRTEPERRHGLFAVKAGDPQPARLQPGVEKGLRRRRILRDPGLRRPLESLRGLALYRADGDKLRPKGRPDPMPRRLWEA
jgi:hypothetical protein